VLLGRGESLFGDVSLDEKIVEKVLQIPNKYLSLQSVSSKMYLFC
jgi:hypothetical protein